MKVYRIPMKCYALRNALGGSISAPICGVPSFPRSILLELFIPLPLYSRVNRAEMAPKTVCTGVLNKLPYERQNSDGWPLLGVEVACNTTVVGLMTTAEMVSEVSMWHSSTLLVIKCTECLQKCFYKGRNIDQWGLYCMPVYKEERKIWLEWTPLLPPCLQEVEL